MALKSVLDSLEELDPALHEHYIERQEQVDGKSVTRFYLDITDDIRQHPKGRSLNAAVDRVKAEKKTLTDKLSELEAKFADLPDDFDAEQFAKDMDELADLRKKVEDKGNNKGDKDKDQDEQAQSLKRLYDQRITNLEKKYGEDLVAKDNQIRELEAEIERLVADEGLTKHLISVGVDKKYMPGATALLRRSVKVRKEEDGHRLPIMETGDGEVPLDEYIQNWAQSDEGAIYIQKPAGGGATGSDAQRFSSNPFKSDEKNGKKPNLTEMQQIIQSNPAKARQMAQAAGWDEPKLKEYGL